MYYREVLGLTRKDVAKTLGVSYSTVLRFEEREKHIIGKKMIADLNIGIRGLEEMMLKPHKVPCDLSQCISNKIRMFMRPIHFDLNNSLQQFGLTLLGLRLHAYGNAFKHKFGFG